VVCMFGFQHLFPPGPVLHISNITAGEAASEMIETLLKQHCVGGLAEPLRFFEQVHASLWASGLVACETDCLAAYMSCALRLRSPPRSAWAVAAFADWGFFNSLKRCILNRLNMLRFDAVWSIRTSEWHSQHLPVTRKRSLRYAIVTTCHARWRVRRVLST
jgi:hypothetical protein